MTARELVSTNKLFAGVFLNPVSYTILYLFQIKDGEDKQNLPCEQREELFKCVEEAGVRILNFAVKLILWS